MYFRFIKFWSKNDCVVSLESIFRDLTTKLAREGNFLKTDLVSSCFIKPYPSPVTNALDLGKVLGNG